MVCMLLLYVAAQRQRAEPSASGQRASGQVGRQEAGGKWQGAGGKWQKAKCTPLPRSTAPVFMKKERLLFIPPNLPTAQFPPPTAICYTTHCYLLHIAPPYCLLQKTPLPRPAKTGTYYLSSPATGTLSTQPTLENADDISHRPRLAGNVHCSPAKR